MLQFGGRVEQLDEIAALWRTPGHAPIIVTGPPGVGRTALLREALKLADPAQDVVVVVAADGSGGGSLGPEAGDDPPRIPATPDAVHDALTRWRAPVFVIDDAHRLPHRVVRMLRDAHRTTGARLLLSRSDDARSLSPDPVDCLRYEAGVRFLALPPLDPQETAAVLVATIGGPLHESTVAALHAATGGHPGLLRDLLANDALLTIVDAADPVLHVDPDLAKPLTLGGPGRRQLLEAVRVAWRELAVSRLTELCVLALRAGVGVEVVPVWAFVTLLEGRADEGLDYLDRLPPPTDQLESARQILSRALLLALGSGRIDEAQELLLAAGRQPGTAGRRLLAARTFLMASLGLLDAIGPIDVSDGDDQEVEVFMRAAAAVAELAADRPRRAVPHLRRAIIKAATLRVDLPWLTPYLTGALIDALLLSGRISEATETAAEFHAAHEGSGWDVAVSLSAMLGVVAGLPSREIAQDRA
jgi:hypothetical protein